MNVNPFVLVYPLSDWLFTANGYDMCAKHTMCVWLRSTHSLIIAIHYLALC